MIRHTVYFTGLEVDPARLIQERCLKGVIPPAWGRTRCSIEDASYPMAKLNRWLANNIEGRWAAYIQGTEIVIAFENDFDGMTFVLSGGKTEAFRE